MKLENNGLNNMEISIIIICSNERGLLKYCLRSLAEFSPTVPYEIIIVENASHDGSQQLLKKLTADHRDLLTQQLPLKVIYNRKSKGYTVNNNLGLKQASGKYVVLLNADIFFVDHALDKMYRYLEDHPTVGLLAPRLLNPDWTTQVNIHKFPTLLIPPYRRTLLGKTPWGKKSLDDYDLINEGVNQPYLIDWAITSAVMIRKKSLEQIGLLDERFFLYFPDVDLCRRLWQNNWPVAYLPTAALVHLHRRESAEILGLRSLFKFATRIHIIDWVKYLFKYHLTARPSSALYQQKKR